ncbi:TPA: hypothetical protein ACGJ7L_006459 [Pseudomonas aeruginosa]|uniref:Uncharacterized protein n=4 Tax=Pseudomonas aeruginosa TaxID=287 RepID=A0A9P1VXD4_PSEAI|nr:MULTISPECIES: hypothetical protein [Pseudomonas]CDI90193.1 hypothetical protein BN889_02135 [Pseudomonas aeruginosa PA38182]AKE70330.1 hypothetical protein YQ19_19570 [Pseudomonas aeruginosa]ARG50654.1 hypothetical protein BFV99_15380 [Pseudomonas aeruginosa]EIU2683159.1 hypothetical protein [Pseudomonas aeruginosa]EJA3279043.1 hypothetical protein [Pseudomonas aeruginosa]
MAEELRKRALALYTPPFSYDSFGGYIWDAKQNMVADNHVDGDQVLRVRGWGRIVYMENPEELQDEFGAMLAEALTEYVERRNGSEEGHVVVPRELLEELLEAAKDGAAHKGEYLSKKYGEPELFAKFDTLLQS